MDPEHKIEKQKSRKRVHHILAESYTVYLFAFILGLLLSAGWPLKIFENNVFVGISVIIFLLSSILILWAQRSSKKLEKENLTKESFEKGPYRFTRNPTNLGLFLLVTCFGIIINSFFVVLFTLIAFFISRLFFIKKEEALLASKYGEPYLEYKKIVRF
jgi:protein-S-isoprenylcysteine O-methyltransferase Ste14